MTNISLNPSHVGWIKRPLLRMLRCTGMCECPERQDAERGRSAAPGVPPPAALLLPCRARHSCVHAQHNGPIKSMILLGSPVAQTHPCVSRHSGSCPALPRLNPTYVSICRVG